MAAASSRKKPRKLLKFNPPDVVAAVETPTRKPAPEIDSRVAWVGQVAQIHKTRKSDLIAMIAG